jgi:hypothetical protein
MNTYIHTYNLQVTAVAGNTLTVATSSSSHTSGAAVILHASTTLAEGATLSPGDFHITVSSVAMPTLASGEYIQIDSEIIRITGVSGNVLTVARGVASTSPASHADGSTVRKLRISEVSQVGGLTAAGTSLTVASTSSMGLAAIPPNVYVRVGAEVMYVTGLAGQTLTVARGKAGTAAVAHSDGEMVVLVPQTLLNGAADGVTTTMVVSSPADLPRLVAGVYVQVDDEVMEVTAVAGDTLTVSIVFVCVCVCVFVASLVTSAVIKNCIC